MDLGQDVDVLLGMPEQSVSVFQRPAGLELDSWCIVGTAVYSLTTLSKGQTLTNGLIDMLYDMHRVHSVALDNDDSGIQYRAKVSGTCEKKMQGCFQT